MKTLRAKVEQRTKTNGRRYLKLIGTNGKPLKQHAAIERRRNQLARGAERRTGEKIVGQVSTYQAGVHMTGGDFSRYAADLAYLRKGKELAKAAEDRGEHMGGRATSAYFQNVIERDLKTANMMSNGLIRDLRKI
tara:strand:+ start:51238 stop:51642 length:405 start_codon:yes stop_codon:yes gene_type:complete